MGSRKINIFGVGRSATKAVQLYLGYLSAKKKNKVKLNYEPYYWQDRLLSEINYEGVFSHIQTPLFLSNMDQISEKDKNFLNKLNITNKDVDIINKFIRANGRAEIINEITKPDYTIVVIRDLYQVLSSLTGQSWNLLGKKINYPNVWEKLINEVKKNNLVDNLESILNQINSEQDRNAFYWYVMNLVILESKVNKVFYINYKNLGKIKKIVKDIGINSNPPSIYNEIFYGDKFHTNYPLKAIDIKEKYFKNFINSIIKKLNLFKAGLEVPYKEFGTVNRITEEKNIEERKSNNKEKQNIKKNELYEYFNSKIFDKFYSKSELINCK